MKRVAFAVILSLLTISVIGTPACSKDLILNNTPVKVLFSPGGGCTDAICTEIGNARSDILVQAYQFTSAPIAKALVNAHKRGVKVQAILDISQRGGPCTSDLIRAGIPTYIDARPGSAHNKILIIDRATVITGSFNFTPSAEKRNRENVIIVKSKDFAKLYTKNWKKH